MAGVQSGQENLLSSSSNPCVSWTVRKPQTVPKIWEEVASSSLFHFLNKVKERDKRKIQVFVLHTTNTVNQQICSSHNALDLLSHFYSLSAASLMMSELSPSPSVITDTQGRHTGGVGAEGEKPLSKSAARGREQRGKRLFYLDTYLKRTQEGAESSCRIRQCLESRKQASISFQCTSSGGNTKSIMSLTAQGKPGLHAMRPQLQTNPSLLFQMSHHFPETLGRSPMVSEIQVYTWQGQSGGFAHPPQAQCTSDLNWLRAQ